MTTTPPIEMEAREVVRCTFADCRLTQFKTVNNLCRRCHRPLEVEEPIRPGPVPVQMQPVEPSAEAGLQVAGQVKDIRRARHMSQRQLAGRMQVPRTYISKIENGKAIPTLGSLDRLAEALGVDVRQLVRDSRSQRDDEVASILADPLLAEIAALLPQLDSLHRSLLCGTARDMASSTHRRIA
jgi:transcriptional regulator with XRE-family HTH domain